jgi:adenylate cyclase
MDVLLRRHILAARRSIRALQETSGAGYEVQKLAVGFVDIVGSTTIAARLTASELGQMLAAFEAEAFEVVLAGGGRVVKLIGDEVMFVAPDSAKACAIAIALTDRFASHPLVPSVRGAVSVGDVLSRDGDYFGPVVNLAARAVKVADPGEVVVPPDARAAAEVAGCGVRSLGATALDGIAEAVELYAVKRT